MVVPSLYLASQSPRRRELLNQIGINHRVLKVDVPEIQDVGESPFDYIERLALSKAQAGVVLLEASGLPMRPVLGADTIGVIDDRVLEKPRDYDDFAQMMQRMSGRSHQVATAIALHYQGISVVRRVVTDVYFRPLNDAEILAYWNTGEPCDKAGGYGIQGFAAVFVEKIIGSYSNVVGLPLETLASLCKEFGCAYWQKDTGDE